MSGETRTDLAGKYGLEGSGPWFREVEVTDVVVPDTRVTSVMPEDLEEQFISSIKQQGVVNPIKLIFDGNQLVLVDGLHRLEAALNAKQLRVPAVIQRADMRTVLLQNLTSGKLQGRGKATDMIRVVKYLVEEEKMTLEDIAAQTGYKLRYLSDLLSVAKAHPDILMALDEEKIPLGAAVEIARIPDTDAQLKVLWNAIMYRMTIRDVKDLVDKTIEELERRRAMKQEEKPRTPRELVLLECHLCGGKVPAKDMRTVFLCPHCMNILWDMKLEAERQVKESMSKSEETHVAPSEGSPQGGEEVIKTAPKGELRVELRPSDEEPKSE
jgi:ParB-like chromosome segregation protein Spo0J